MQNKIKQLLAGIIFFLLVISGFTVKAQGTRGLRINEVLVNNVSNYEDDYGERSPWIEIINATYSNVNIGGCYLTNDLGNPTKYWIPSGTAGTAMLPEGYVIFFANNQPTRGVFHLNFDLRESKFIALFDADGKTLIDKVELIGEYKPDMAYARVSPEKNEWKFTTHTTPGSNNDYSHKMTAGEEFVAIDPYGVGMTVISMSVVFSALVILFVAFSFIFRLMNKRKAEKIKTTETVTKVPVISGEVNAAIAMALYLYKNETHDLENTVLTVKKVAKTYSPWSSKIYTLRKNPR
ncbi:MAG: OadG family transporter subunit [Mangrovibacterium sp.]